MYKRILVILILVFTSISLITANPFSGGAPAKNPFAGKPEQEQKVDKTKENKSGQDNTEQKNNEQQEKQQIEKEDSEPGLFSRIWQWFVSVQKDINRYLTDKIKSLKMNFNFGTFLLVFFLSIFYGVLHSFGPGHGKLVVSSYFIKEDANYKDLFLLSGIISVMHNLSAGIISALLAFLSHIDILSGQNTARSIAMLISGIILIAIGIYYFINSFRHDHGHFHQPFEMDTDDKGVPSEKQVKKVRKMGVWAVGISAGIVPCPLSIAVIFFGLYLNAITIVIVAVIGMSIGMAVTEFIIGYASMKVRTGIFKVFKKNEKAAERVHFILGLTGAVLIILFGIFIGASFFA